MYICQICKKAPATIHLTDIHNNVKKELHMCESCAAEKGFNMQTASNLPQLLGLAAKKKAEAKTAPRDENQDALCSFCGSKWSDFKTSGRLGCPNDYKAFGNHMRSLVANQLSPLNPETETFHVGKVPSGSGLTADPSLSTLRELERRLRQAVAAEHYEEAATLKTEIDALKTARNENLRSQQDKQDRENAAGAKSGD